VERRNQELWWKDDLSSRWLLRRPHPSILMAYWLEQEETDQLQQCGDIFFLPTHFIDEHKDMKHDARCQHIQKRN
jgi:hypothetical protein